MYADVSCDGHQSRSQHQALPPSIARIALSMFSIIFDRTRRETQESRANNFSTP